MALATLRTGRPGRPAKDWLPFEEARAFARSLALRSGVEWRVYHRQNNPLRVPVNPHSVYRKKGYVSICDWLDYNPYACNTGNNEVKKSRTAGTHLNSMGAQRISKILNWKASVEGERIQLFAMPPQSRFTFLYRVAGAKDELEENADRDWVPFSVRATGRTKKPVFRVTQKHFNHPIVCADLQEDRYYILSPSSTTPQCQTDYFCPSELHAGQFEKSCDDLPVFLREWWESDDAAPMKKSIDLWLRDSFDHEQCRQWIDWILQIKNLLYKPLGVRLGFTHNLQQQAYNSFLNDVPVVHQVAWASKFCSQIVYLDRNNRQGPNSLRLPFPERSKIGFAICGVRDQKCAELAGFFCFPQKILIERGILGSETDPGRPSFSVFPPFLLDRVPRFEKSREAAAWQREFYIDLSDLSPKKVADAQRKLKRILSQNSFIFANN